MANKAQKLIEQLIEGKEATKKEVYALAKKHGGDVSADHKTDTTFYFGQKSKASSFAADVKAKFKQSVHVSDEDWSDFTSRGMKPPFPPGFLVNVEHDTF